MTSRNIRTLNLSIYTPNHEINFCSQYIMHQGYIYFSNCFGIEFLMLCALWRSTKYQFLSLDLTRSGLEPMVYSTQAKHSKYYTMRSSTTEDVNYILVVCIFDVFIPSNMSNLNNTLFSDTTMNMIFIMPQST